MLKDLNGQVVPHPTEYIVMVGDEVTLITKRIAYNRVASFVHKSHALAFAKSITSFHTAVIDPDPIILKMLKEVPAPRPSRAERAYGEQQFFHD